MHYPAGRLWSSGDDEGDGGEHGDGGCVNQLSLQELGNVDQSAEKDDRDDILDETFSAGIWTVDSLNATKKGIL